MQSDVSAIALYAPMQLLLLEIVASLRIAFRSGRMMTFDGSAAPASGEEKSEH